MKLFIDTADIAEIKKWRSIISGVTTNPTIMKKCGILYSSIGEIADVCHPLPLSIEVRSELPNDIINESLLLTALHENIVIKIPIHSKEYCSYLTTIKSLSMKDVKINVTAMMNSQQCMLASMAGARYASIFTGRVADMGYDACKEICRARLLCRKETEIIAASCREVKNITDWLLAGADIVTVTPNLLTKMVNHPYTRETVEMFMRDAK